MTLIVIAQCLVVEYISHTSGSLAANVTVQFKIMHVPGLIVFTISLVFAVVDGLFYVWYIAHIMLYTSEILKLLCKKICINVIIAGKHSSGNLMQVYSLSCSLTLMCSPHTTIF